MMALAFQNWKLFRDRFLRHCYFTNEETEPQEAVTCLRPCSHFVPELGLELLFLRSYWVPIPDPHLAIVWGGLSCTSSCHKAVRQNCLWASPPLGDSVPFLRGSRILRLPDRCGNHTPFQGVFFHCISILGCCSLLLGRAGLAALKTAWKRKGRECARCCTGAAHWSTREDAPPACQWGNVGAQRRIGGRVGVSQIHHANTHVYRCPRGKEGSYLDF